MESDGWAVNIAEADTNPGGLDGDGSVDGAQGGDVDTERALAPGGGGNRDGGTVVEEGGAQAGDVDVLQRILRPLCGLSEYIIHGVTWDSLVDYTLGFFA